MLLLTLGLAAASIFNGKAIVRLPRLAGDPVAGALAAVQVADHLLEGHLLVVLLAAPAVLLADLAVPHTTPAIPAAHPAMSLVAATLNTIQLLPSF